MGKQFRCQRKFEGSSKIMLEDEANRCSAATITRSRRDNFPILITNSALNYGDKLQSVFSAD